MLSLDAMPLLAQFLALNRRLSKATEDRLPATFKRHLHTVYKFEVAALVNRQLGQVVLDIGGGKECPFLPFVEEPRRQLIVAIDYSAEELHANLGLDRRIVADAAAPTFPFRDSSADLIVSRSVVEHLHDNRMFFENCARVLRPGGVLVHTFPCKFAPFALLNQILPNRVTRRLIAAFHPQWQQDCGFLAFYDRCYFSAVQRLLECTGFKNLRFTFRYYQSIYFDFFFPLYVVMLAYDLAISFLGIRNLACAILVTAEQPSAEPGRPVRDPAEQPLEHVTPAWVTAPPDFRGVGRDSREN
jgi:SAM-dependent methyltransferase